MKVFKVQLEIEAQNEDTVYRMIDQMPHADRILSDSVKDEDERFYQVRIRYTDSYRLYSDRDPVEAYVFEGKWSDEDENKWSLDTAFQLLDYEGEKGILLNYQALTKIRELQKMQIPFYFC